MTNRELLAKALAVGAADKQQILEQVLAAKTAPVRRVTRAQSRAPRAAFAGWACAACLSAVLLVGYFNGNITIGIKQAEQIADAAPQAALAGAALPEEGNTPNAFSAPQVQVPQAPQAPALEPQEAPESKARARDTSDGWVITNPELYAESLLPKPPPEKEAAPNGSYQRRDKNESGSGGSKPNTDGKPNRPSKPDTGDGESNPDTGGNGEDNPDTGEDVVTYYTYQAFCSISAYTPLVPKKLPQYFVPAKRVGVTIHNTATLYYSDKRDPSGAWISLILQSLPAKTRGGGPPEPPTVTVERREQVTTALLSQLDSNAASYAQAPAVSFLLDVKGYGFRFSSEQVSYEQAAAMLQSLPLFD